MLMLLVVVRGRCIVVVKGVEVRRLCRRGGRELEEARLLQQRIIRIGGRGEGVQ